MTKLLIFISIFTINFTHAAIVEGVTFPDKVNVFKSDLVLNGTGIRKATFLKIKVYIGALYLSEKSTSPDTILNSKKPKQIIMHFLRDVEAEKIQEAFIEGFEAAQKVNSEIDYKKLRTHLDELNKLIPNMKKNERLILNFSSSDDLVEISIKGGSFNKISAPNFSKALLSIWFKNARDEGLRDGLLGI